MRLAVSALVAGAGLALAGAASAADYPWQPEQPITIIVPWAAGGSTDQVTRVVAGELEEALGQSVVIVNQPGASGSVGTKSAMDAERDGYTWAAGAVQDLGTYPVLDMLDTRLEDWALFFSVANVGVVGVNADTPYQTFDELIAAMKERPGQVSVATAGISSAGHNLMEAIAQRAGVEYRHVTYDGGNPAVIATVAGETEATTQLASEQAEMIRAGRIRPLAVYSTEPLELEGHGTIPPITEFVSGIAPATNYFGIWAPKDVPEEVLQTMEQVWEERIKDSEALKRYAANRGALFTPIYGEEAQEKARPAVAQNAWLLHEAGKAQRSPEEFGIERPGSMARQ
ncbi:MAG TPA: tripartite tricarboxylate transporter substrate binding protein [Geminicoccaceae bacterium]|nr:tripartite tricarboxylate transporter substrate binding protein [Geminicoccaceae bacterium]